MDRISDRGVTTGEGMLNVFAHAINRYDVLSDKEANALLTLLDEATGSEEDTEAELSSVIHDAAEPHVTVSVSEDQSDTNTNRFIDVSEDMTDAFIEVHRNKNTLYKTRSDLKIFQE